MPTQLLYIDTITETYGDAAEIVIFPQDTLNDYYSQEWSERIDNGDARPTDEIVFELFGEEPDSAITQIADEIGTPLNEWTPFNSKTFGQSLIYIDRRTALWGDARNVVLINVEFDGTETVENIYDQFEQIVGDVCDPDDELEGVAIAPFTRYI